MNGGVSGGNPDPISRGTAWLYLQFAQGTLLITIMILDPLATPVRRHCRRLFGVWKVKVALILLTMLLPQLL